MGETVIVYDVEGNQISPKPNKLGKLFKEVSSKDIINYLRQVPSYVQIIKDLIPTETISIVFSEHTQDLINAGAKFGNSKYGDYAANLYDSAGKLVGQASFKNDVNLEFATGIGNSVNQLMLQQQFGEMIAMLDSIYANIERVLIGQHNDRIALCESAEQMLIEATKVNDEILRRQLLTNALQTAHQARGQLTQTFIDDVAFVADYIPSFFGKNYEKEIKPRTQAIKQSIMANYKATKVCAMSYAGLNEHEAMSETLSYFEKLLTKHLTSSNLEKLNSLDSDVVGFWLDEPTRMTAEISDFLCSNNLLTMQMPVSLLKGNDLYD